MSYFDSAFLPLLFCRTYKLKMAYDSICEHENKLYELKKKHNNFDGRSTSIALKF